MSPLTNYATHMSFEDFLSFAFKRLALKIEYVTELLDMKNNSDLTITKQREFIERYRTLDDYKSCFGDSELSIVDIIRLKHKLTNDIISSLELLQQAIDYTNVNAMELNNLYNTLILSISQAILSESVSDLKTFSEFLRNLEKW